MKNQTIKIAPRKNETEESFVVRAHRELMDEIPDWQERNSAVWDAWDESNPDSKIRKIAQKNFPENRYTHESGQCYFVEHQKRGRDGKVQRFDVKDLCEIARTNNSRILDGECFQAISDGHTSPDRKDPEPPILGYAGNYRIGMVGHDTPRFAVFGDEYHRNDKRDVLAEKPRRSIELLTMKSTGQRFFDPIAALGATSPALAMPSRYSLDQEAEVERYSFVADPESDVDRFDSAAAMPGGSNTYIPDAEHYSAEEPKTGGTGMLSNEDISQIVQAIGETPEIQYIRTMMSGGAGAPTQVGADPNAAMGGDGSEDDGGFDPAAQDGQGGGDGFVPLDDDDEQETNRMSAFEQEISVERFAAIEQETARLRQEKQAIVERYSALADRTNKLEQERADALRESDIRDYTTRYSCFDFEEECERCLFSAGSQMTDEQFAAHVADREKTGSRLDTLSIPGAPRGVLPGTPEGDEVERYSARAIEIHTSKVDQGEFMTWNEALAAAKSETVKSGV